MSEPREVEPLSEDHLAIVRRNMACSVGMKNRLIATIDADRSELARLREQNESLRKYADDCAKAMVNSPAARDAAAAESESLRLRERNERLERVVEAAKRMTEDWPTGIKTGVWNETCAALAALEENQ